MVVRSSLLRPDRGPSLEEVGGEYRVRRVEDPARPSTLVPVPLVRASQWSGRLLVVAAALAVAIWGLSYISLIVIPLIVGTVIAALLEPVRRGLIDRGWSHGRAWPVAFLFGVAVVTSIAVLAVSQFSANWDTLTHQAGSGLDHLNDWLHRGPLHMRPGQLEEAFNKAISGARKDPSKIVDGTLSALSTGASMLAAGLLTLITTLFVMKDRSLMWTWFCRAFPPPGRARVDSAGRIGWNTLVNYTRVTLTSAVVDSVCIGTAAAIAGLPVAFALATIVFLVAFIPMVGAIFSGALVVLVALVSKGVGTALIMALVVLVVQQLDANVMYPYLASRHLALHPLASLLLVAGGGVAAGVFGAFVAVPIAAMTVSVVGDLRRTSPHASSVESLRPDEQDEPDEPDLSGGGRRTRPAERSEARTCRLPLQGRHTAFALASGATSGCATMQRWMTCSPPGSSLQADFSSASCAWEPRTSCSSWRDRSPRRCCGG
ncbi:MAG: AI-2E family transporter [Microthrixaceae bacterium]